MIWGKGIYAQIEFYKCGPKKILEVFHKKTDKDMGVCDPRGIMAKQEKIKECPKEGNSSAVFQRSCGYS